MGLFLLCHRGADFFKLLLILVVLGILCFSVSVADGMPQKH